MKRPMILIGLQLFLSSSIWAFEPLTMVGLGVGIHNQYLDGQETRYQAQDLATAEVGGSLNPVEPAPWLAFFGRFTYAEFDNLYHENLGGWEPSVNGTLRAFDLGVGAGAYPLIWGVGVHWYQEEADGPIIGWKRWSGADPFLEIAIGKLWHEEPNRKQSWINAVRLTHYADGSFGGAWSSAWAF